MRALLLPLLLPSLCIAELPHPLKQADGTVITTKEQWEKTLRPETLQHFRENIYGVTPVGKPEGFMATVTKEIPDALTPGHDKAKALAASDGKAGANPTSDPSGW